MVSRTRPSSDCASSPPDWETSVSRDPWIHTSPTLSLTVGAPVAGRLSDIVVRKWGLRRKGVWYPEDRLRATWIGGLFMVPLSVGASGLLTTYVGGPVGLSLNLLCLFINGMGVGLCLLMHEVAHWILQVDFVMNPISSYHVDVVHSRSAEIIAACMSVSKI
jgi:MFS family permease